MLFFLTHTLKREKNAFLLDTILESYFTQIG
jgi:hypothetical protein